MKNVDTWPALYECEDLHRARMVATCLNAMEFETHLSCGCEQEDGVCDRPPCGPYAVRVSARDFAQLLEVVDEILEEQDQFDVFLDRWHDRSRRAEQRLVLALVVIVGALGAIGAIEL